MHTQHLAGIDNELQLRLQEDEGGEPSAVRSIWGERQFSEEAYVDPVDCRKNCSRKGSILT